MFLATFEHAGSACIATSSDLKTWSSPRPVISGFHGNSDGLDYHVNISNPELCLTKDGTLLLAVNYRPSGQIFYPFSIVLCRSEDGGASWSSPDILYCAGCEFENGCWEPSFIQLPDGTIHIYFANEGPYRDSKEQEISCLTSDDDGKTWEVPSTMSFRPQHRDGMPVAALIDSEIVVAIEDNSDGKFKPYTVRNPQKNPWAESVDGTSPLRTYALRDPLPSDVYAGAPYLVALPSGESLLSYQTTENRHEAWELSCMEVAVSDSAAMDFCKMTRPFDVPIGRSGKWNSICVIDSNTVAAVTSTDKDGIMAPYVVKGHLIRPSRISPVTALRDIFFVGSSTCDNLTAGLGYDDGTFIFRADVCDSDVVPGDGVVLLMDLTGRQNKIPQKGVFMISVNHSGRVLSVYEGKDRRWKKRPDTIVSAQASETPQGYSLTLSFSPRIKIPSVLKATVIHSNASSDGSSISEHLVHSDPAIPSTWLSLELAVW